MFGQNRELKEVGDDHFSNVTGVRYGIERTHRNMRMEIKINIDESDLYTMINQLPENKRIHYSTVYREGTLAQKIMIIASLLDAIEGMLAEKKKEDEREAATLRRQAYQRDL